MLEQVGLLRKKGITVAILSDQTNWLEEISSRGASCHVFIALIGDHWMSSLTGRLQSRVADEVRADAVIVGASTKAGHRWIGSLAVRLVKAGRWPVTVVP